MCQIESIDAYWIDRIIFAVKGWLVIVYFTVYIPPSTLQSYIIVYHGEKTCSNVTHAQLHSLPNIRTVSSTDTHRRAFGLHYCKGKQFIMFICALQITYVLVRLYISQY
jgi:hypothetical protein